MVVVDVNILIKVVNTRAPEHPAVLNWWEKSLREEAPIGLSWIVLIGFLRVSTDHRILPNPLSPAVALAKLKTWIDHPGTQLVSESVDHLPLLRELVLETGKSGAIMPDAHLAAIAIGNGAKLASCDVDFARFSKLRWVNPLAA
jgi:uncharacterized protein